MIESLSLSKFTVFDDLQIDFGPKINILIGENGTGKTHLLKAAYAMCSANGRHVDPIAETANDVIASQLTTSLIKLFLPLDEKLGKLRTYRSGSDGNAELDAHFIPAGRRLKISFHNNSLRVTVQENAEYERYSWKSVFIPTKEVLSFMLGFSSLYRHREVSFDQTYDDLVAALELPVIRPQHIHEKVRRTLDEIEDICGGVFVFHGSGKVTFKSPEGELSANAMAEGFRKIGMIGRLLRTGAVQPGVSGPLFWDEPEASLNPKRLKWLVSVLLELSRLGQQVILATHDYILLKWFDLLADRAQEDHVKFHALFKGADGRIRIESTDDYLAITPNAIADTFGDLYDEEIKRSFGGK